MRLLLADETNRDPNNSDFFVYGALYLDMDHLEDVHKWVKTVRKRHEFEPGDPLKWSYHDVPDRISREEHNEAKKKVIKIAHEVNAEFVVALVNHELAEDVSEEKQFKWAIRTVLSRFDYHLREEAEDTGICAVDTIPGGSSGKQILGDIFQNGLTVEGKDLDLDSIKMISTLFENAAHAASVMDIVLGAFGYCMKNPGYDVCEEMFADVAQLTRGFSEDDGLDYKDGVLLRPGKIRLQKYKKRYGAKRVEMNDLLDRSLEKQVAG